jgi:acyl-coenzyme A thioesterase PaaI-like protein
MLSALAIHGPNARGLAHGGFLAGLADVALGYARSTSQEPPVRLITGSLSLDFAGSAKVGDWIEARVDLQHVGRQLGFANANLVCASGPGTPRLGSIRRVCQQFCVTCAQAGRRPSNTMSR